MTGVTEQPLSAYIMQERVNRVRAMTLRRWGLAVQKLEARIEALTATADRQYAARCELVNEVDRLEAHIEALEKAAAEQAEEDALWFVARTAPEAYLQKALRRLHALIEGDGLMAALAAEEKP